MEEKEFSEIDLILALSESIDLVSPVLVGHHSRVAYIALHIALELNVAENEIKKLIAAALLHDIGAISLKERMDTLKFDLGNHTFHAEVGYNLLKMYEPLYEVAQKDRYHHKPWNRIEDLNVDKTTFYSSSIIHLADRVDVLIDKEKPFHEQLGYIINRIKNQRGKRFCSDIVDGFIRISDREDLWKDLRLCKESSIFRDYLENRFLNVTEVIELSKIFEKVIDFRSRFTATHSSGVAYVAESIARICGFSNKDVNKMKIAGHLHDLGKLAISKEVLEKDDKLSDKEYYIIRSHALHTYSILGKVKGFEEIKEWAGLHHEKLNGKGYPFGKAQGELSIGSKIMTIADIFTAISEDRPYREGMKKDRALYTLEDMSRKNEIDIEVLKILKDNYGDIDSGRKEIQLKAIDQFKNFWDEVNKGEI